MDLCQLLNFKFMTLDEIKKIESQSDYINSKKPNPTKLYYYGEFEGYDLYTGNLNDPTYFYLEFRQNDKIIGWYVYRRIELYDVVYANDQRIFIDKDYLRKGIASKFYYFVRKIEKLPILSDEEVTPEGEAFYRAISKKMNVSILNIKNGKKEKFDDNKWSKIFSNNYTKYRLVFEYIQPPLMAESILAPYLQYGHGDI